MFVSGLKEEQSETDFTESIDVKDDRVKSFLKDSQEKIYKMRSNAKSKGKYSVMDKFTKTGAYVEITISRGTYSHTNAIMYLKEFRKEFPNFVSMNQVFVTQRFINEIQKRDFLPRGYGRYNTLYDYYKDRKTKYIIQLKCSLVVRDKAECWIHLETFLLSI